MKGRKRNVGGCLCKRTKRKNGIGKMKNRKEEEKGRRGIGKKKVKNGGEEDYEIRESLAQEKNENMKK